MRLILDLLNFLMDYFPFLMNLAILTLLVVLLADSIKKHAKYYYLFFYIIGALTLFQYFNGLFEWTEFSLYKVPVIGKIIRTNSHMLGFGYPLLVIIMYVGALDPKNKAVKKVLMIRKELSLIAGCPVLCHSLFRVTRTFIRSLHYFGDVISEQGERTIADNLYGPFFANIGYQIGILLVVLFLVLWITSFEGVHRSLGNKRWKKVQNWSYLLYGLLFLHSTLLNIGWMLSGIARKPSLDGKIHGYIALGSILLVFGSYLYLRLRKAKQDRLRKRI